jgi:hypothetical protein
MKPKVFRSLDNLENWARENPDKVARHILKAWRKIVEGKKDFIVIIKCKSDDYLEDMNIIVEKGEEKEALESLLNESIEREDYELAKEIKSLQEKVTDGS